MKLGQAFDTLERLYRGSGAKSYKDAVMSNPETYLRSVVSRATGKPASSVTPDELSAAEQAFRQWSSGKKNGGPVDRQISAMKTDGDVMDRATRATEHWRRQNRYARGGTVHRKGMFKRGMKDC